MAGIDVSVALPPSSGSTELITAAEELGYRRAYLFDTPFEGDDIWLGLHRAAEVTTTIELGPGVLIPTQRHPLVNAALTVSLHHIAPGRVVAGFGTGFSSRAAVGQPPIRWSYVEHYVRAYCDLLAGGAAEWEGEPIALMLPAAQTDVLPLRIPLLIAAIGPRGFDVARRVGADGVISMFKALPNQRDYARAVVAVMGTVVDESEDPTGERVRRAVGAPWAAATYHLVYTSQGPEAVRQMPGGCAWLDVIEKFPRRERHLHAHRGHMVKMNEADMAAWHAGGHVSVPSVTLTGSAAAVGKAVAEMANDGATEIMYEPSGPDIARELSAFMSAARG